MEISGASILTLIDQALECTLPPTEFLRLVAVGQLENINIFQRVPDYFQALELSMQSINLRFRNWDTP